MSVAFVLNYGADGGTPATFVTVGAYPDGTVADQSTGIPDIPPEVTLTVRVDASQGQAALFAEVKAALASVVAQGAANEAAHSLITPYLGQPVPLS